MRSAPASARRRAAGLVLFVLLSLAPDVAAQQRRQRRAQPTSKPAATRSAQPPEPTTPPASAVERLQRLKARPDGNLKRTDAALRCGMEFGLALGVGDADRALAQIDAVGYQPLPRGAQLSQEPGRALLPDALREPIRRRPRADVATLPPDAFVLKSRAELREIFPAAARWMGDDDFAVVVEATQPTVVNWVTQPGCVIVRLRGKRATIVGGTILEDLLSARAPPPGRG